MIFELFLIVLTIYVFRLISETRQNLPPGPTGLPFLGRLPYLFLHECLEAKKKYGNVFMLKVGAVRMLYICDYKLSKEALSKTEFADRPDWKAFALFERERREGITGGVIFSSGRHWIHTRRFLLGHLRDLGMGKSKMEGIIMREVEDLVEDFKGLTKEPSKLPFSINIAILNIIWQLLLSHRYEFKNEGVKDLMEKLNEIQEKFIFMIIPDFFPFIEYLLPKPILNYFIGKARFYTTCQEFEDHLKPFIDEHIKSLDPNNPRDLIDDYLIEMKERKSEDYSHFNVSDLMRTILDLFVAGTDTTSNMTRWVLTYMAKFQGVQNKIQEEIDRVVPRDTLPGLQHRNELAYLDATINEVQRHCSMVSLGLFRYTTTDLKLGGFEIPKKTAVMSVTGLIHKDKNYWKNPEEFDPSRFLDENGKYIPTCDGFLAFGKGKRQCLGEQFARMELFLITASLLQNFTFGHPDGGTETSIEPENIPNLQIPQKNQKYSIKYRGKQ